MLYYLFEYLTQQDVPGMGAFTYISPVQPLALILSLILAIGVGIKSSIGFCKTNGGRHPTTTEGQTAKVGTPTMGIIIAILVSLLLSKLNNIYILLMIVTTVWLGALRTIMKVFKQGGHTRQT